MALLAQPRQRRADAMGLPAGGLLQLSDSGAAGTAKKPDNGIGFGGICGHDCLFFLSARPMRTLSPPRPGPMENRARAGGGWRQNKLHRTTTVTLPCSKKSSLLLARIRTMTAYPGGCSPSGSGNTFVVAVIVSVFPPGASFPVAGDDSCALLGKSLRALVKYP